MRPGARLSRWVVSLVAAGALCCGSSAFARGGWLEWKGCQLEENDSNDGDSFHVRVRSEEYILRLYFVDAPETDSDFPERVAEQAKYFGITSAQSVELGEIARKFAQEKLARPFIVHTRKQNAMGRSNTPRYYALVETAEGDLGEMLVANGLARVHGVGASSPGRSESAEEKQKLTRLEQTARRKKVGGWGAKAGGMNARLPTDGGKAGLSAFDAFFHPERAKTPTVDQPVANTAPRPVPAVRPVGGRLDVNTATVAELIKINGVGPVLAGRIIEARPFKSPDELRRVKGIGPKIYAKIRPSFGPE